MQPCCPSLGCFQQSLPTASRGLGKKVSLPSTVLPSVSPPSSLSSLPKAFSTGQGGRQPHPSPTLLYSLRSWSRLLHAQHLAFHCTWTPGESLSHSKGLQSGGITAPLPSEPQTNKGSILTPPHEGLQSRTTLVWAPKKKQPNSEALQLLPHLGAVVRAVGWAVTWPGPRVPHP